VTASINAFDDTLATFPRRDDRACRPNVIHRANCRCTPVDRRWQRGQALHRLAVRSVTPDGDVAPACYPAACCAGRAGVERVGAL